MAFAFSKTVRVTNNKNILVQVPRAVASDWQLKIDDTLEVSYTGDTIVIRPVVPQNTCVTRQRQ